MIPSAYHILCSIAYLPEKENLLSSLKIPDNTFLQ